jgi:ATP-binding cassette subfamily B protein
MVLGSRLRASATVFAAAWRRDRRLTIVVVLLAIVDAALPLAATVLTGVLVERAVEGGTDGLVVPLVLFALINVVPIGEARWRTSDLLGVRVGDVLDQRVMRALLDPPGLSHLMDPEVQDETSRAVTFWNSSILEGITNVAVTRATGYGAAVILVATGHAWSALLLGVAWAIAGRWSWDRARRSLDVHFDKIPDVRRAEYARDLAYRPEAAKELRTFGLGHWVVDRFVESWTRAMSDVWRDRRRGILPSVAISALVAGAYLAVLAALGRRAVDGSISVGQLAVSVQAALAMVNVGAVPYGHYEMEYGLRTVPANARLRALTAEPRFALPGEQRPQDIGAAHLRVEHVTFAYPHQTRPVLRDVSLDVPPGSSLAIVGENGAGKTTLVKLLCRYFDPDEGRITLNGIDLVTIDARWWHDRIAGLFQDFVRYPMSARDNVALGSGLADDELDAVAARAAMADLVAGWPKGWDTQLTRSHQTGIDLSGGEWQRLALARALVAVRTGAALLVLDEPTAHLDAKAEADLYDRFLDLSAGATSIVISHRFSTVRRADRIVVLDEGAVVESGTHDELVALGGRYAEMFRTQAARFHDA